MRKLAQKKRKGFTLIELIIVLAILAIIAAIAIPNFASVRQNSRNKTDVQSAGVIKRTVTMYVADETIKPEAYNSGTGLSFDVTAGGVTTLGADAKYGKTTVEAGLKDVKAPQGFQFTLPSGEPIFTSTNATKYVVVITTAGEVTVHTN